MQRYLVTSDTGLPSALSFESEAAEPTLGPFDVKVAVAATSLNYRDLVVLKGGYPRNDTRPAVPLSDGAGTVVELGSEVSRLRVGDRVAANFMAHWVRGAIDERALDSSLGGGIDGMLAERVVFPEHSWVKLPESLSFAEAATLPCAALTAWNALTHAGTQAGDTVLLLGTGGVSIFALQFAKAMGLRVVITSKSDEKLARAQSLGADLTVNYAQHEEWQEEVLRLTDGRGVDHAVEVGGPGTLERSLAATRIGGTISLIGLLDLPEQQPNILPAMMRTQLIRGIYVGSVAMFEQMLRAVVANHIEPIIDQRFAFQDAPAAYEHFSTQQHFGKVVIEHG